MALCVVLLQVPRLRGSWCKCAFAGSMRFERSEHFELVLHSIVRGYRSSLACKFWCECAWIPFASLLAFFLSVDLQLAGLPACCLCAFGYCISKHDYCVALNARLCVDITCCRHVCVAVNGTYPPRKGFPLLNLILQIGICNTSALLALYLFKL